MDLLIAVDDVNELDVVIWAITCANLFSTQHRDHFAASMNLTNAVDSTHD